MRTRWSARLWAGSAGVLLPLSFAPFEGYLLSVLSLAILFRLWHDSSPREAFQIGYIYGFTAFLIGVGWVYFSIHYFGEINRFLAAGLTVLLISFLALYPALAGMLARILGGHAGPAVQQLGLLPAVWVLMEWLRSWLLSGFPWLNLGASQTDSILRAMLPVLGVYGVSWLVALTAGASSLLTVRGARRWVLPTLLFVALSGMLAAQFEWTRDNGQRPLKVALVQGAIPQAIKWQTDMYEHSIARYLALSLSAREDDLVIWPETAITRPLHQAETELGYIRRHFWNNSSLLIGLPYRDSSRRYYNGILVMDDEAVREEALYLKYRLVPFGEYLPFSPLLQPLLHHYRVPMSELYPAQTPRHRFITRQGVLGLSICYEIAYGGYIRKALPDAELLVNVANDAWFGDSWAPHQHLQIARVRALETGRYLLRATNTGISAIIDAQGTVQAHSPQFTPYLLQGQAMRRVGSTPFVRLGYWPSLAGCLLVLCSVGYRQYRRSRRGTISGPDDSQRVAA